MLISEFLKLTDAGYSLDLIRRIAGRDFAGRNISEEELKKLMRFIKKAPVAVFSQDMTNFANAKLEAEKQWEMPDLKDATFESVTNFSSQTDERIKITVEDYQKYFDELLSMDEESEAKLTMEIYSQDKTESFTAYLLSSEKSGEEQRKYKWTSEITYTDQDFWYLLSYIISVLDSSSALNIPVAEGIARGKALVRATLYAGKLLNSRFSDLFRDFFSPSQS